MLLGLYVLTTYTQKEIISRYKQEHIMLPLYKDLLYLAFECLLWCEGGGEPCLILGEDSLPKYFD